MPAKNEDQKGSKPRVGNPDDNPSKNQPPSEVPPYREHVPENLPEKAK